MARRLALDLDLTYVELDAINWQPGWVELRLADPPEF